MAKANPFRFSTKYQDDETDLLYYGKRYFSASAGRWLNYDPIGQKGGKNLYAFVQNAPVANYDYLGLSLGIPTCGYGCIQPGSLNEPLGECDLAYNFDDDESWWEFLAQPSYTKWITTISEVSKDIEGRMTKCCCIRKIYFTAHSGAPGVLTLGEGAQVPGNLLERLKAEMNEAHRRAIERTLQHEREFLQLVSRYMCKGGHVTFVECNAAQGPEGAALKAWLESIFGPDVDITLFEQSVRWFYRSLREECKSRQE
jgi:RHS repeat-associated protein